MTLLDVLREAATEPDTLTDGPPVVEDGTADGVEWSTAGVVFAAADGTGASFRLTPTIGRAALGTPDTGPSPRGRDWVVFRPKTLDRFAIDRAGAWFAAARRAASRGPG